MKLLAVTIFLAMGGCVSTSLQFSYERDGAAVIGTVNIDPSYSKQK